MDLTPQPPNPPLSLEGELRVRCVDTWACVDGAEWNALNHAPAPFLRAGFLSALEQSASVGQEAGWEPHYLLIEHRARPSEPRALVGALAAYRKVHSYGEYIFDWGWAQGAQEARVPYYPKLVVAAPMTPATGPRLLVHPQLRADDARKVQHLLVQGLLELGQSLGCHSVHGLFIPASEREIWRQAGFLLRDTFQYHWHDADFGDMQGFLGALNSRRRKQIRKERKRALEAIDEVRWVSGSQMTPELIDLAYSFYRSTVAAYGSMPYLRREFFELCPAQMGDAWQFAVAMRGQEALAGALFFEGEGALFGRYWGAKEHVDCLHFELAYYQGIERCLRRGLHLFEAGAQGQHKLLRGFLPSPTYSAHAFEHPGLSRAVSEAVARERHQTRRQMAALIEHGQHRQCSQSKGRSS